MCVASCHRPFLLIFFFSFFFFISQFTPPFPAEKREKSFGRRRVEKRTCSRPSSLFLPLHSLPPPLHLSPIRTQILAVTHAQTTMKTTRHTMYVQPKRKTKKEENDRSIVVRNDFLRFFATCNHVPPRTRSIFNYLRRDRSTIDYDRTTSAIVRWVIKKVSAAVPATGRWYSVCFCVGSLGNTINKIYSILIYLI